MRISKKLHLIVVLLLSLFVFFGFSIKFVSAQTPTTYYIDAVNGSDNNNGLTPAAAWQTLEKATGLTNISVNILPNIKSGDTVILNSGIYYVDTGFAFRPGGIAPSSGIFSSQKTTFKAATGARPIITSANLTPPSIAFSGNYIKVDGLWIGGTIPPNGRSIQMGGNPIHDIELINSTIFGYETGIVVGSGEYILIQNNRFINTGYGRFSHGIYLSSGSKAGPYSQHLIVDNNIFAGGGIGGFGMQTYGASGSIPRNNIWTRNFIANHWWGATPYGSDNLIANNFFYKELGNNGVATTSANPNGNNQIYGLAASDVNSKYYNNIMAYQGWGTYGYGFPASPSWTGNTYDKNAECTQGTVPNGSKCGLVGTGQTNPWAAFATPSGTINLTYGNEAADYGIDNTTLDNYLSFLKNAFNIQPPANCPSPSSSCQTINSLLTDANIESRFTSIRNITVPPESQLYRTGFQWFGQPVDIGWNVAAPGSADQPSFWTSFSSLGFTEYNSSGVCTVNCASSTIGPSTTPSPTPIPIGNGDVNGDGVADAKDVLIVFQNYGKNLGLPTDQYGDGLINTLDFAVVVKNYPTPTPLPTNTPTPSNTPIPTAIPTITPTSPPATPTPGTGSACTPATGTICVNNSLSYQTIVGWEATAQDGGFGTGVQNLAINDLGINRIRLEIHNISAGNAAPDLTFLDTTVNNIILPMKTTLPSLIVNAEYVDQSDTTGLKSDPTRYAGYILQVFNHLKTTFNFVPDYVEVQLEPDSIGGGQWTGTQVGNALAAAGSLLAANGYHPKFSAPSTTSMANAITYFDQMIAVPGVSTYLKEISFHRYTGVSQANLQALASRAATYGITTAMTEHIGSDHRDLQQDLKFGNVSAWQQYTLAFPTTDNGAQYYITASTMGWRTKLLWQYFHYVRPGAVRIDTNSAVAYYDPVAFINQNGKYVVVVKSIYPGLPSSSTVSITGLPAGIYAVTWADSTGTTTGSNSNVTISAGQTLNTIFNHAGAMAIAQQ